MTGFFSVEFEQVEHLAGRLTEVVDALGAAVDAAGDLTAVSGANPGFAAVDAAIACATAWLDEVTRLTGRVTTAQTNVGESVATYRGVEDTTQAWFDGQVRG